VAIASLTSSAPAASVLHRGSDYSSVASLAHRGLWTVAHERNSLAALTAAFATGWGAELDVRDLAGSLVVSHDPPDDGTLPFEAVVRAYREHGCPGALAVNVKADGLSAMLANALRAIDRDRWFAFDMSVPDMRHYAREGLPFFTRHSDLEPTPALYHEADGVWLDDFDGGFITEERIVDHLDSGKRVAVVSPELHGRDRVRTWEQWRDWRVWRSAAVLLCTDHPTTADEVLA
jgi:glycerophosphoryl diester phosphodiesterase